jgi:Xaa-Pro aminopeptidase
VKNNEIFNNLPHGTNYFLVTNLKNIRYLVGFTGDSATLLFSARKKYLFTDSRFTEQAEKEVKGCDIIITKKFYAHYLKSIIKKSKKVAFESNNLLYSQYKKIRKILPKRKFTPVSGVIEQFRLCKSKDEINKISKAAKIADKSFSEIRKVIKPGKTEIEIASNLEYVLRKNGSTGHPFSTIALTSTNTSLPHGHPGNKKIKKGDFFLLDFGATYKGYISDMTRTVVVGKANKKQKKIYNIVLKAQMDAINAIKSDMKFRDIDKVAREVIKEAGYEKNFGHGLGHGIGLNVHENPSVSARSEYKVQEGMVFTIEPGIYIPGWGGVRIEDDIAFVNNKVKILIKSPKEKLIEV